MAAFFQFSSATRRSIPLPHRLDGLGEAPQGSQIEGGQGKQPGLVRRAQVRRQPAPRLLEERRHRPQVRADRPELGRAVVPITAGATQDAVAIDLFARLRCRPARQPCVTAW